MQPFVHRVFHPTDFSPASGTAFAHALAIAVAREASLTILHVGGEESARAWQRYPRVRDTLERWGLLAPGSAPRDLFDTLSLRVKKVGVEADDPVEAILDYLAAHPTDLMVLATEGREGLPRFLRDSVAQRVARTAGLRTLFVPAAGRGFVDAQDGSLSMRRILVPVAETPDPQVAVEIAARAVGALGAPGVEIRVMHAGARMPATSPPAGDWRWSEELRGGEPVDAILAAARELPADALVMTTDGRDGFLDVFRGSHAERVVRAAPCPVLAIPVVKPV